jgi:hypothetical protein
MGGLSTQTSQTELMPIGGLGAVGTCGPCSLMPGGVRIGTSMRESRPSPKHWGCRRDDARWGQRYVVDDGQCDPVLSVDDRPRRPRCWRRLLRRRRGRQGKDGVGCDVAGGSDRGGRVDGRVIFEYGISDREEWNLRCQACGWSMEGAGGEARMNEAIEFHRTDRHSNAWVPEDEGAQDRVLGAPGAPELLRSQVVIATLRRNACDGERHPSACRGRAPAPTRAIPRPLSEAGRQWLTAFAECLHSTPRP